MNTTKRYNYNSTLGNKYAGYKPKKHIKLPSIVQTRKSIDEEKT